VERREALRLVVDGAPRVGVELLERLELDAAVDEAPGAGDRPVDEERGTGCGGRVWRLRGRCSSGRVTARRAWTSSVAS
jgi:hypothetical protein